MNTSLRSKLLVYMTANILLFAVLLTGASIWLTKPYYEAQKQELLEVTSEAVRTLLSGWDGRTPIEDERMIGELNRLEQKINGVINIGEASGSMLYPNAMLMDERPELRGNPFFRFEGPQGVVLPETLRRPGQPPLSIDSRRRLDESTWLVRVKDNHLQTETMRLQTEMSDGIWLLVWVPMEDVGESVAQTRTWIFWLTIISLLITAWTAYMLAGKFIRPLTAMTRISENMARLDFSETLDVKGSDELALVSLSINKLSAQLDDAIQQLHRQNKQLESDIERERQLEQMRRAFVSNVSHELKTPIFLIQGYAEGLSHEIARDPEKRAFYARVIMEETEKMDLLVKDLLQLSQLEAGALPTTLQTVQLTDLVRNVMDKLAPLTREKEIRLSCEVSDLPVVETDPLRVEQMLINFLNNAFNHADERKLVKVTVGQVRGNVRVTVFNTGAHIPEDKLELIWQSFFKVDANRTRAYGGTGLGLSIVRAIQQSLGRAYGVENVADGVEFWFEV